MMGEMGLFALGMKCVPIGAKLLAVGRNFLFYSMSTEAPKGQSIINYKSLLDMQDISF